MRIQPYQEMETTSEIENAPAGLKLDQIQARYGQIQEELHAGGVDSMAYTIEQRFGHQLAKSRAPEQMAGCVCINFGSFTSPKYEELCKQKNRPMFHLAAFELFKKQLDARAPIPIASNNVLFHDPEMNEEDVKFLETVQGYRVMRNLDMGWMIRRDVFVYTPCATFDHIEKMIRVDWPAVFVGVDYKGWPETLEPKEEYDDAKNEKLRAERQGKRKIYREVFGAYFATLTSQELLVMKESYQFPTVTAYCTRISG